MKKYIIDESEKNEILSMHKALMKEQKESSEIEEQSTTVKNPQEETLRSAIKAGCLKSGRILTNANRDKFVYRATTKSGKEVDFMADMTYSFKDGSKSGRWQCEQLSNVVQTASDINSKIETFKKQGYKTLDELRKEGVDLNTLDKVYDTIVVDGVTLYRQKGSSTKLTQNLSTAEFNQDQNDFIDAFTAKGYKLNPSRLEQTKLVKITDKELGAPADLFPNGLVLWYDPNQQKDIKSKDGSVLGDILANQSVDRNVCRKNIDDYFKSFQRKNSIVIDAATITKAKRIVQACKDEHYGKWGIAGGGNRLDNYLDILSGNKDGGPSRYGDDSVWRLK